MKSLPKLTAFVFALVAAVYWLMGTSLLGFQQPVGKGQVTVLKPDSVPRERSADAPGAESPEAKTALDQARQSPSRGFIKHCRLRRHLRQLRETQTLRGPGKSAQF